MAPLYQQALIVIIALPALYFLYNLLMCVKYSIIRGKDGTAYQMENMQKRQKQAEKMRDHRKNLEKMQETLGKKIDE